MWSITHSSIQETLLGEGWQGRPGSIKTSKVRKWQLHNIIGCLREEGPWISHGLGWRPIESYCLASNPGNGPAGAADYRESSFATIDEEETLTLRNWKLSSRVDIFHSTQGRIMACNDNDSLHRWNMTKHTGFQSFLIFSYLFYITIFAVIWFCRRILGCGRSYFYPFQRFGHQDSDSESSFGSYSEDDEEPAVPAPFGEPKKRCCEQGGGIQTHVYSCHFPKENIIELEMDWLCWNYFCWILGKCGNDRRQNFLFNGVSKVQHWFRVAGQRRCSHKDEELRWLSRWTKELPASHTNLNTPRLLGSFVDIHHFSAHPPSHLKKRNCLAEPGRLLGFQAIAS